VTSLDVKFDKHTRELEKFKGRHAWDAPRAAAVEKARGTYVEEATASTTADSLLVKAQLGYSAATGRSVTKVDCPNAYLKARREKRSVIFMEVPPMLHDDPDYYDENGELMVLEIAGSAVWGESAAGRDWQKTLHAVLLKAGWEPAENVPCLYRREMDDGHEATVITIVDDLLVSEKDMRYDLTTELITSLNEEFEDEMTYEREPTSFNGRGLSWDRARGLVTLRFAAKIASSVEEYAGAISRPAERLKMALKAGSTLDKALSELKLPPKHERSTKSTSRQKLMRSIVGVLRWIEQDNPSLSKRVHCLSRVIACPPPEATDLALAVLAEAFDARDDGLTLGAVGKGQDGLSAMISTNLDMREGGAPEELAGIADATWGDDPLYALIVTAFGASIYHSMKCMHMLVDSSTESEAVATGKIGEVIAYAREVWRGLGIPLDGPVLVGTDNRANMLLSSGEGAPSRMRHAIRRFKVFVQRVERGETALRHVPDPGNASDYMTKFVDKKKYKLSHRWATGAGSDGSRAVPNTGDGARSMWGDE